MQKEDSTGPRQYEAQIAADTYVEGNLAEYTLEMLPEPVGERVKLAEEPGRLMAAVKYSATWSKEGYEKNKALLEEHLRKRGLTKRGAAVWAR